MSQPCCVLLAPELYSRIWGGTDLEAIYGEQPAAGDEPFGEAWIAHADSRIASGSMAGERLSALLETNPSWWLGASTDSAMPVLIKILDARERLSIQVHPDDAYARMRHPERVDTGKTETWRVLSCDDSATVYWGFSRRVTEEMVRHAIANHELPTLLRQLPVRAGDVIHNPAGTVHAIGAGIQIFEVQQPSDLTYRLYDFGRVGLDGQPRELHIDDSLAVMDASGQEPGELPMQEQTLPWRNRVACPYYSLDEVQLEGTCDAVTGEDGLHVVVPITSSVELSCGESSLTIPAGWSALVAAQAGAYQLRGHSLVMRVRAPSRMDVE